MSNEQENVLKKNKWKNKQYCAVSAAQKNVLKAKPEAAYDLFFFFFLPTNSVVSSL